MVNVLECNDVKYKSDVNICRKNIVKIKKYKSEVLKIQIKRIMSIVQNLEKNLSESDIEDRQLLRQLQVDNIKKSSVTTQLTEARKENKQLTNILQQKYQERYTARSPSDFSSTCSTMSMVNLQYKYLLMLTHLITILLFVYSITLLFNSNGSLLFSYEELLNGHENLLKLLSSKDKEIQRLCKENDSIIQKTDELSNKLLNCESILNKICTRFMSLKDKKDLKINKLKNEKEALLLAHNKLVKLLSNQYMDCDGLLSKYLHETVTPQRALLLKEVQRANALQHKNILLKQEIAFLKLSKNYMNDKCATFN